MSVQFETVNFNDQVTLNANFDVYKGTHGTCDSIGRKIRASHFIAPQGNGRRGRGIYFWGYVSPQYKNVARNYAYNWWQYSKDIGKYSAEANTNYCIIFVEITVDKKNIYDFNDTTNAERFQLGFVDWLEKVNWGEIAPSVNPKNPSGEDINILSTHYHDIYIKLIEEESGNQILLVKTSVQMPCNSVITKVLTKTLGFVTCYVVRDVSCISVEKTEFRRMV